MTLDGRARAHTRTPSWMGGWVYPGRWAIGHVPSPCAIVPLCHRVTASPRHRVGGMAVWRGERAGASATDRWHRRRQHLPALRDNMIQLQKYAIDGTLPLDICRINHDGPWRTCHVVFASARALSPSPLGHTRSCACECVLACARAAGARVRARADGGVTIRSSTTAARTTD